MKKVSKKILALILTLIMVVGVVPAGILNVYAKDSMYFPVCGTKTVSSGYGTRTFQGETKLHSAIDITGGTVVIAAKEGTVVEVYNKCKHNDRSTADCGHNNTGGNSITIKHSDGTYTSYLHLKPDTILVKVGDKVFGGQKIATVGSTGKSTGPHLHFAYFKGSVSKHPYFNYAKNHINNNKDKINYTYINSPVAQPKPAAPKITKNVANDIAINSPVSVTWSKVANATGYKIFINDKQVATTTAASYNFKVTDTVKKNIKVKAYNSKYDSAFSNTLSVTAHNDLTVTFIVDGVETAQKVKYGGDAIAPLAEKEGYTFTGWDKNIKGITSDVIITAQFKIKTFTVRFVGSKGEIIGEPQIIEYGGAATPPEDKMVPDGYAFINWSTSDYLCVKKNLDVQAIYDWANKDIPLVHTITSATRQSDGYYVYVNLENHVDKPTHGRAVVSLKTAEGKLIDTTESAAFSIPANGTKSGLEVFVPCEKSATIAEVIIVDSYSSGVPISASQTKTIDQGLAWGDWQDEPITDYENMGLEQETRTVYRYQDKATKTVTNTTANYTMSGWTKVSSTVTDYKYGVWSNWSETKKTESNTLDVEDRAVYKYFHYCNKDNIAPSKKYTNGIYGPHILYYTTYKEPDRTSTAKKSDGTYYKIKDKLDNSAAKESDGDIACPYGLGSFYYGGKVTQYRSRSKTAIYTHTFYQWNDWSDWSADIVTGSSTRNVEQKVQYRYRSDGSNYAVEDNSGTLQSPVTYSFNPSFAGKQVTLFVYKIDEASDYTNEYVSQTTVGDDGTIVFPAYRLREEPTAKTGDFTIALGIEGSNEIFVIGKIEAPKPQYNVIFEDIDGTVLGTSTVAEGNAVTPPENPAQTGKIFVGWDNSLNCINRFMVNEGTNTIRIKANYIDETFTVVFVNYELETVEVKTFNYGETLVADEQEPLPGRTLTGWSDVIDCETVVTSNMIVEANYVKDVYTVEIKDFNGNIIETQEVEYGEAVQLPDDAEMQLDSHDFCGWEINDEEDELNNDIYAVTGNMTLVPQYMWEETCPNPTASITSGDYDGAIQVELTCDDENAVIYYTTDGSNPDEVIDNGGTGIMQYNGTPITINMSCELKFMACSMNKNDSEVVSELYAVNGDDARSPWMLYEDIPQNVKDNLSHHNMITAPGYRYKNLETASDVAEEEALAADGWTYIDSTFSEWSGYSITEPVADGAFIEVETTDPAPIPTPYYVYNHWKYFDEASQTYICSNVEVEGTDGEWETIELDSRLYVSSFIGATPAYTYDGENWFDKEIISKDIVPDYKLYRYRAVTKNYYKWTEWTDETPAENETREIETSSMVFSYTNPDFYVITIDCGTIALEEPEAGSYVIRKLVYGNCPLSIDESEYMVDGYDFAGFYTDAEFTQPWDMNANITDSITLYSKYNIKTYTVDFVKEDGEVIDTQTVEYLGAAVPPEVITPDGYVFMGWDTDDYEWVTDNLTVTARILDEDDVIKISLNRTSFTLMEGSYFKLSATLELGNNTDDTIVWKSSDYSILDVDDNGNVYAVSTGKATITAVASDGATASCVFTVAENPEYDLFTLIDKSTYAIDDDNGYLRGIKDGMNTVAYIKSQITNNNIRIVNNDVQLNDNDFVGTGTKIQLIVGEDVISELTAIVTGDMNGDGCVNNRDVSMVTRFLVEKESADVNQLVAIDVNGDGYVNNRDAAMISRYLVGKETF